MSSSRDQRRVFTVTATLATPARTPRHIALKTMPYDLMNMG